MGYIHCRVYTLEGVHTLQEIITIHIHAIAPLLTRDQPLLSQWLEGIINTAMGHSLMLNHLTNYWLLVGGKHMCEA